MFNKVIKFNDFYIVVIWLKYTVRWKPFLSVMMSTDISECNFDKLEPQITVVCDDTDNGWILFDPKIHLNIKWY
jgi:hypothetical protein